MAKARKQGLRSALNWRESKFDNSYRRSDGEGDAQVGTSPDAQNDSPAVSDDPQEPTSGGGYGA